MQILLKCLKNQFEKIFEQDLSNNLIVITNKIKKYQISILFLNW